MNDDVMVFDLFHKFRLNRIAVVISILVSLLLFSGCDPRYGQYPYDLGAEWICKDPYITLSYSRTASGILTCTEFIELDDERVAVDVDLISNQFCIQPCNSSAYDDRFATGTWKYRKSDLVFVIEEDFVFDHKYTEFVFECTKAVE